MAFDYKMVWELTYAGKTPASFGGAPGNSFLWPNNSPYDANVNPEIGFFRAAIAATGQNCTRLCFGGSSGFCIEYYVPQWFFSWNTQVYPNVPNGPFPFCCPIGDPLKPYPLNCSALKPLEFDQSKCGQPGFEDGQSTLTYLSLLHNTSCYLTMDPLIVTDSNYVFNAFNGTVYASHSGSFIYIRPKNPSAAHPIITTQASPVKAELGDHLTDVATLHGGNLPTGTLTFDLYKDDLACGEGSKVFTNSIPITDNGSYSPSSSYLVNDIGTYRWKVSYNGDANNFGYVSNCDDANEKMVVTAKKSDQSVRLRYHIGHAPKQQQVKLRYHFVQPPKERKCRIRYQIKTKRDTIFGGVTG